MDGGNSTVSIGFINDHADLDLAGRDHMDVDVLAVESFKHGGSRARVALHTGTDNADLGAVIVDGDLISAKAGLVGFQHCTSGFSFALGAGKDHILAASAAGRLQNDIHVDVFCASRLNTLKDIPGTSGTSRIETTATSSSLQRL